MLRTHAFAVFSFAILRLMMASPAQAQTSRCDLNSNGAINIADVQMEINEALGTANPIDDLNDDGWLNVVDIQIVIDASFGFPCPADNTLPSVTGMTPASGIAGATLTISLQGAGLWGAVYTLQGHDPTPINSFTGVTVVSQTGTAATITVVLGGEGPYDLIVTNFVGASQVTPVVAFVILPKTHAVANLASVLNTGYSLSANQPYLHGSSSFEASVLNTSGSTAAFPPHDAAAAEASVLNTVTTISSFPPLPAGQANVSVYASVLNTKFNSTVTWQSFAATVGLSVCNTASGCVANVPKMVSLDASASALEQPPRGISPAAPSRDLPAELEPLEERAGVIVGQTIRLSARNVDPGSRVEFEVNRTAIATVGEPPYDTLFTVPDGTAELSFQVRVEGPDQAERLSRVIRVTAAPDAGASLSGGIAQRTSGLNLSLAAGGLLAEYFHLPQPVTALPSLEGLDPVRSAYVTAINQPNPRSIFGEDPLGAGLSPDYAIRFSGEVRAETNGLYRFWLAARSGAAIRIDGKPLADTGFVSGDAAEVSAAVDLRPGWHSLQVIYYLAVGAASARLEWQPPDGSRREVVGPDFLRMVLSGVNAVSAAGGEFVFSNIPAKFDTVWIRVKNGAGWLEFPAVKPGVAGVLLSVPK